MFASPSSSSTYSFDFTLTFTLHTSRRPSLLTLVLTAPLHPSFPPPANSLVNRKMQPRGLLCTFLVALAGAQRYELQAHFPGATFLDNFDFVRASPLPSPTVPCLHTADRSQYTSWDPTYGYVHYVDRLTAESHGMISYTPNTTRWGVETTEILDPSANLGRLSLRLMSKQSWTHGLFVLDLKHMPHNSCGAWPAYWLVGSGVWPSTGECPDVRNQMIDESAGMGWR